MYSNSAAVSRPELTTFLEQCPDLETGLLADKVLPIYNSKHRAGRYPKLGLTNGELLKSGGDKRAPGGSYNRVTRKWDWDTFDCEDRGLEEAIDDVLTKEMDDFLDMEQVTSKLVARQVKLAREIDVATLVMSPSNSGMTATNSAVAWTEANLATIDFPQDIQAAQARLEAKGYTANTLVMSRSVYNRIIRSTKLQTFLFGSLSNVGGANITGSHLKDKFEIENILVTGRSYDTAKKGQTASLSAIWGTSYVALIDVKGGDFKNGGLGRSIVWDADSPGGLFTTETYREEGRRGDVVRIRSHRTEKIVDALAGELVTTQWS